MPGSYSFDAEVRLTATFNGLFTPANDPEPITVLEPDAAGEDILSITVQQSIGRPFGTFAIEFAPRTVLVGGRSWGEIIRPYTLVAIGIRRRGDPEVQDDLMPVMLGLVYGVTRQKSYSTATPHRVDRIVGRALSAVLVDHRWWYHHWLASALGPEQLPADFRELYQSPPDVSVLRDEAALRAAGLLAFDPRLFELTERHPVSLAERLFRFFVEEFIRIAFADGTTLADRLTFDGEAAREMYVDPAARLAQQYLPTSMPEASCWDAMRYFLEPPWTELYSETRGDTLAGASVAIVARKPPWAGAIGYQWGRPAVAFLAGRPTIYGQSLFEQSYGNGRWLRENETIYLRDEEVVSITGLSRGVDGAVTLYDVKPAIFGSAGQQGDRLWGQVIPPIVDEELGSPSEIRRYGIRPFRAALKSLPVLGPDDETSLAAGDVRRHALAYAALAREWYYRQPEFWRASYTIRGRPDLRPGMRLVDQRQRREYYVVTVTHQLDWRSDRPSYTTTAQLERGWDLEAVV